MDIKKILALTVIVLAVFSCMNVASAGLFDFLLGPSEAANQTYAFDGFTLDIPETANVTKNVTVGDGYNQTDYSINWTSGDNSKNVTNIGVSVAKGSVIVTTAEEFVYNWVADGAKSLGNYSGWSVIDVNGVPVKLFQDYGLNFTYSGYMLAKHTGSELIVIEGDDLALLKNIADTYKKA